MAVHILFVNNVCDVITGCTHHYTVMQNLCVKSLRRYGYDESKLLAFTYVLREQAAKNGEEYRAPPPRVRGQSTYLTRKDVLKTSAMLSSMQLISKLNILQDAAMGSLPGTRSLKPIFGQFPH
uniref:Uncharacterized protein n=1 Tax=Glossina pallidipes TaxID=7398 RepID=A0A1A9ZIF6_GLOPL